MDLSNRWNAASFMFDEIKHSQKHIFHVFHNHIFSQQNTDDTPDLIVNTRTVLSSLVLPHWPSSLRWELTSVRKWVKWHQTQLTSCLLYYSKRTVATEERASCYIYCTKPSNWVLSLTSEVLPTRKMLLLKSSTKLNYNKLLSDCPFNSLLPIMPLRHHRILIALKVVSQ